MTVPTPPAAAPVGPRTNTLAIIALIAAFVIAPAGIIIGFIAKGQIKQSGEAGSGLATAGIVIGFIVTALYIIGIIVSIASYALLLNTIPSY